MCICYWLQLFFVYIVTKKFDRFVWVDQGLFYLSVCTVHSVQLIRREI